MLSLYALGSNGSGQLGIGHRQDVSVPKDVLFDQDVRPVLPLVIRAGGNHTLLLSSQGRLYCAGDYSSGACGLEPDVKTQGSCFREVLLCRKTDMQESEQSPLPIAFCAATWEATIIVRNDREGRATEVYSFGTGNKGELGNGEALFHSSKAQLIKGFPPSSTQIVDLSASMSHVVAILCNGDVYGWGNGRKGQLGQPIDVLYEPRKIEDIPFSAVRAVCGRDFTCIFSKSTFGACSILGPEQTGIRALASTDIMGWLDVAASWRNVYILMQNGQILSWGRNDHGQLASPDLPKTSYLAAGSEHALCIDTSGDVLTWGWGEHGNCGPSTANGDVSSRYNTIASSKHLVASSKIVGIAGGCATTWIIVSDKTAP